MGKGLKCFVPLIIDGGKNGHRELRQDYAKVTLRLKGTVCD